jgi:hypothetical protein
MTPGPDIDRCEFSAPPGAIHPSRTEQPDRIVAVRRYVAPASETCMNTYPDNMAESRLAVGIKTAALVALISLVAVVAHPTRMSDDLFVSHAAAAEAATSGDTQYFPAQFAAPTTVAEQAPTF